MKISVIIPMYNAEKTIEGCVESAAGQKVEEILLIDDGSEDRTLKIAEDLQKRFRSVRVLRQQHGGVSKARNLGIREAAGEWIIFLDADDHLTENAVGILAKVLRENTDACCGAIVRGNEKRHRGRNGKMYISDRHDLMNYVLCAPTDRLTVHGWIFRRNICLENGVFFNPVLRMGEDSEWVLRYLACCSEVGFTSAPAYRYTISADSTINKWKPGQTRKYLETLKTIEKTAVSKEKNWPLFVLTTLLLILTHDTFHPANPASWKKKMKMIRRLRRLRIFASAFEKADLSGMDRAKRLALLSLKAKIYLPVWMAVRARQIQNSKRV